MATVGLDDLGGARNDMHCEGALINDPPAAAGRRALPAHTQYLRLRVG